MSAVLPTRRAHDRTREAVLWVEEERTRRDPEAPQDQVEPVWVLTTSATADASGDYPGVVTLYRAIDHTWEDLTAAVRVRGIAGEALTNATRYACRPAGVTAGGEDLYVLIHSVGGGSLTIDERTGYPLCAAALESFGASTLHVQQGYQSAGCGTVIETGLRLHAAPANPGLYLNPCGYFVATDGGAVVPALDQTLGYDATKYFGYRVIISKGISDRRPVLEFTDEVGGTARLVGSLDFHKPYPPDDTGYLRLRGFGSTTLPGIAAGGIDLGAGFLRFYALNSAGNYTLPLVQVLTGADPGGNGQTLTVYGLRFAAGWLVEVAGPVTSGMTGVL